MDRAIAASVATSVHTSVAQLCLSGAVLALSAAAVGFAAGSRRARQPNESAGRPHDAQRSSVDGPPLLEGGSFGNNSSQRDAIPSNSSDTGECWSIGELSPPSRESSKPGKRKTRTPESLVEFRSRGSHGGNPTTPTALNANSATMTLLSMNSTLGPGNPLEATKEDMELFIPSPKAISSADASETVLPTAAFSPSTTHAPTTINKTVSGTYVDVVAKKPPQSGGGGAAATNLATSTNSSQFRARTASTSGELVFEETQGASFLDYVVATEHGLQLVDPSTGAGLSKEQQAILKQMEASGGCSLRGQNPAVATTPGPIPTDPNHPLNLLQQQRSSIEFTSLFSGTRAAPQSRRDSLADSGLAPTPNRTGTPCLPGLLASEASAVPTSRSVSAINVREHLFGKESFSFSERTPESETTRLGSPEAETSPDEARHPHKNRKHSALVSPKCAHGGGLQSPTFYHSESGGILSNPHLTADTRKRNLSSLPEYPIWRICVTGGPCSGKSTGMQVIKSELQSLGFRVFIVPEVATLLIQGGLEFSNMTEEKRIAQQCIILRLIMELEDTFFEIAASNKNPSIILCDRGTMDGSAYCTAEQFDTVLRVTGYTIAELRDARYDGVIHLVTAAIGAEESYTTANNEARRETKEEAKAMDMITREKWTGHRMLGVFDNSTDFNGKMKRVVKFIKRIAQIRTGEDDVPPQPRSLSAKLLSAAPQDTASTSNVDCVDPGDVSDTTTNSVTPSNTVTPMIGDPNNHEACFVAADADGAPPLEDHHIYDELENGSGSLYLRVPVAQILRPHRTSKGRKSHAVNCGTSLAKSADSNSRGGVPEDLSSEGGETQGIASDTAAGLLPEGGEESGDSNGALTATNTLSEAILAAKANPLSKQNSDMDVLEALIACGVPSSAVVTDYLTISLDPIPGSSTVRETISRQRTGNTSLYFHAVERHQLDAHALGRTFAEKGDTVTLDLNQTSLRANAVRARDVTNHRVTDREFSKFRRTRKNAHVERKTLISFFHKGNYFKLVSYFRPESKMVLKVPEHCSTDDLPPFFEYAVDPSTVLHKNSLTLNASST